MIFNSYDKNNFKVGEKYYTYFFEETNRGNALKNYTGLMHVECISHEKTSYSSMYTSFNILKSKKLASTISHNIHGYMDGYGSASCYFSTDKDEIIKHHDDALDIIAKIQNTSDRDTILKKLIIKRNNTKPKIERDSIEWLNTLSKKEIKYIKWINEYYSDLYNH